MGPKIKFFLILGIVSLGISVYGYFKAIPSPQNQTGNLPKIEITPLSYDFGEIEFGKIVNYNFKIKNSGQEVLEIKRVATSCGCTTANALKTKINPGEETELSVTYDTAAMGDGSHGKGSQERIIYIKSNDPVNPQVEAIISAYVK